MGRRQIRPFATHSPAAANGQTGANARPLVVKVNRKRPDAALLATVTNQMLKSRRRTAKDPHVALNGQAGANVRPLAVKVSRKRPDVAVLATGINQMLRNRRRIARVPLVAQLGPTGVSVRLIVDLEKRNEPDAAEPDMDMNPKKKRKPKIAPDLLAALNGPHGAPAAPPAAAAPPNGRENAPPMNKRLNLVVPVLVQLGETGELGRRARSLALKVNKPEAENALPLMPRALVEMLPMFSLVIKALALNGLPGKLGLSAQPFVEAAAGQEPANARSPMDAPD